MVGFFDEVGDVAADAVVGHTALDGDAQGGDFGEFDGVVGRGKDGGGEVFADLVFVDVEGGDNFDVLDAVVADLVVHNAGDFGGGRHFHILVDALHEGGGAIADADDGYLNLAQVVTPLAGCGRYRVALTSGGIVSVKAGRGK